MNARRYGLWLLVLIVMSVVGKPIRSQDNLHAVVYDDVRFSFPASLATGVQAETIEAAPYLTDEQMQLGIYPEHTRFIFLNYLDGSEFRLPVLPAAPQILVYSTDSMREVGYAYSEQFDVLDTLLRERPDLSDYVGASVRMPEIRLPFLPWVNSAQTLRSHPQYIEIAGVGSGIRYVTHYSQDAAHITDQQIFYTFQGIMHDGTHYVSAIFPVKTGVLPEKVDLSDIDWDKFVASYDTYLAEIFERIDSLPDGAFSPSLKTLDTLIQSILFETEAMRWQRYTNVTAGYRFEYPPDRQICAFENSVELIYSSSSYDDAEADHCLSLYQANPISVIFSADDDASRAFRAENHPGSFADYREETITIDGQTATRLSGSEVETGSLFELIRIEHDGSYLIFRAMGEENIAVLTEIIPTLRFLNDGGS